MPRQVHDEVHLGPQLPGVPLNDLRLDRGQVLAREAHPSHVPGKLAAAPRQAHRHLPRSFLAGREHEATERLDPGHLDVCHPLLGRGRSHEGRRQRLASDDGRQRLGQVGRAAAELAEHVGDRPLPVGSQLIEGSAQDPKGGGQIRGGLRRLQAAEHLDDRPPVTGRRNDQRRRRPGRRDHADPLARAQRLDQLDRLLDRSRQGCRRPPTGVPARP